MLHKRKAVIGTSRKLNLLGGLGSFRDNANLTKRKSFKQISDVNHKNSISTIKIMRSYYNIGFLTNFCKLYFSSG